MITLLDTNIGAYHIIINSEEQLVEGRLYDTVRFIINEQTVYKTNIMKEPNMEQFDLTLSDFISHTCGCSTEYITEEMKDLFAFIQEICYNEVELEGDIEMLCSALFHVAENSEEKESGLE